MPVPPSAGQLQVFAARFFHEDAWGVKGSRVQIPPSIGMERRVLSVASAGWPRSPIPGKLRQLRHQVAARVEDTCVPGCVRPNPMPKDRAGERRDDFGYGPRPC